MTCFKPVKVITEGNIVIEIGDRKDYQEIKDVTIDMNHQQFQFDLQEIQSYQKFQHDYTTLQNNLFPTDTSYQQPYASSIPSLPSFNQLNQLQQTNQLNQIDQIDTERENRTLNTPPNSLIKQENKLNIPDQLEMKEIKTINDINDGNDYKKEKEYKEKKQSKQLKEKKKEIEEKKPRKEDHQQTIIKQN